MLTINIYSRTMRPKFSGIDLLRVLACVITSYLVIKALSYLPKSKWIVG